MHQRQNGSERRLAVGTGDAEMQRRALRRLHAHHLHRTLGVGPRSVRRQRKLDLGGAETNSEMAVEMLAEDRRARVVVCNAPVVEGAVIAATESSGGSPLAAVKRSAEEFYA
jgi:hypothetical protein